jgi:hypothetical protein
VPGWEAWDLQRAARLIHRVMGEEDGMEALLAVLVISCIALALAAPARAADHDLVILNGRVMDPETMLDAVANVGISDGRIAAITKDPIAGKGAIDARGLVVAPGFIDTHFHWVRPMGYKPGLRDGVTTGMDLEMGTLGTYVDQWYRDREGKNQMNYGVASAHEFARSFVLDGATAHDVLDCVQTRAAGTGWSSKKPNLEEGNKILQIIDEGLRAGAVGIGSTLGYMRDGATARELFEVQRVGARYGRLTSDHFRYTPGTATTEVNGVQELLANAAALGAPAIAAHFNNYGWEMVHELLARMRDRGLNVWGEVYPYAAGSTALNAVFLRPEEWIDHLGNRYEDTLMDPATGEFFTRETYEEAVKRDPTKIVIVYKIPQTEIVKWLRLPGVSIASDAMPIPGDITWDTPYDELPNTHPRTAGAHALTLQLGRENDIPLMQSLSQLSYVSAKHLGDMGLKAMQVRGRLQQGMVADITIFDPAAVRAQSTYEHGALPSTGIPYVVVNGTVVVRDAEVLKGTNPGQPIRFEPLAKGLFEPLSIEAWQAKFMVAPVDFGGTVYGYGGAPPSGSQ